MPVCLVAAAPAAGLAADAYLPVAPKLTGEPIQYLDRLYQDAFIDHEGRAWFLVCGIGLGEAARDAAFDHLVCPDLPGKVIEIPVNNIPLGFDSKGRFWDVTRYGLGCTDAATGEFSERDVAPGKSPDQLAKPHPSQPDFKPGFARVMLEHSSGRLYFIDSYGLHVLDGGTWSYQLFDPAPTWLAVRGDPVKIAECPDGNVAVWGKVGLWTHDGKSWRRHSSQPYELAPLADGQSLVMIEANSMGRVCRLRLKDDKPATVPSPDPLTARWPGFKHILTLPRGVSLIDGYDTSLSRHVLAMLTPAGESVALPPDTELRFEHRNVPRPAGRLPDGRVVLPTRPLYTWDGQKVAPLLANPLAVSGACFGCDKSGRVIISADDQAVDYSFLRLAVISPRVLTAPPSLPVEMFGFVESAMLDSAGQVWAKFGNQAFLSRFEHGHWLHFPPPGGLAEKQKYTPYRPMMVQPLANGCLVTLTTEGACFFDGQQWTARKTLWALVEANADRLRKIIDNRPASETGRAVLGLDAAGRIWATDLPPFADSLPETAHVYDANEWTALECQFLLSPDGTQCVRRNRYSTAIFDTKSWPMKEITAVPRECEKFSFPAVHFDRDMRFIAQELFGGAAYRWDPAGWKKLPVSGHCALADSAGRLWFVGAYHEMKLVDARGGAGPAYNHPAMVRGPVVEQSPGVYWCPASDGLTKFKVVESGGKCILSVERKYPDLVPRGHVRGAFLDGEGWLWIVADRIARVHVPPAEKGAE
jgi:hypothetical protein